MAKDAYYFPHDSNAKDDPKCTLLIDDLGLEGYGIYWVLIETLRDQENLKYPLKLVPSLARKYNTTAKKIIAVIKGYNLFDVDNDSFFFSESLMRRMNKINERRAKLSDAGKRGNLKRWNENIALLSQGESGGDSGGDPNLIASKVKKRKEKEIKEKETDFLFSPFESKFMSINPQEFFERYTKGDEFAESRDTLAASYHTSLENIFSWLEKFRTKMIVEGKSMTVGEFVAYFSNWLNLNYVPDVDPLKNNSNEKKMIF